MKGFGSVCTVRARKPGGRAVELGQLELAIPGRHNVLNALAAVAMARELGIAWSDIARALGGFHGAERRFQRRGEAGGVAVVEDYGHHPTEIAAVIAAAKTDCDRPVDPRVSAASLHAHAVPVERVRPCVRGRRRGGAHRYLRRRRRPDPGRDARRARGYGAERIHRRAADRARACRRAARACGAWQSRAI